MTSEHVADLPEDLTKTKTGLIYLGGAGSNVCHMIMKLLSPAEYPDFNNHVANTDARLLRLHFPDTDERVRMWREAGAFIRHQMGGNAVTKGQGAGTDPETGKRAAESADSMQKFRDFVTGMDNIIIVTGLGGGTGTGASLVVAQICVELKKPTVALTILPDPEDEGMVRFRRATDMLTKLQHLVPTIPISNTYLTEYMKSVLPEEKQKNLTHQEAWDIVNEHSIVPTIQFLRELLQVPGDVISTDQANWETFLKKGKHLLIGWKNLEKESIHDITEESIVEDLTRGHFQNRSIVTAGEAMIFLSHGPIPFGKKKAVKIKLRKIICGNSEDRVNNFETIEGSVEKVSDGKMWLACAIIAPEVPTVWDFPKTSAAAATAHKADMSDDHGKATGTIMVNTEGSFRSVSVSAHLAKRFKELNLTTDPAPEYIERIYGEVEAELGYKINRPPRFQGTDAPPSGGKGILGRIH